MNEQWKVVPVEPTDEMHDAARDWSYNKYGKAIGNDASKGCYTAMLAAAPQPPSASDERERFEADWNRRNYPVPMNVRRRDDGQYEALHLQDQWETWQARAALAPSPGVDAAEPVGEVILFGGDSDLKEVAWKKGKMPPVGTRLYAVPSPAASADEWMAEAERLADKYASANAYAEVEGATGYRLPIQQARAALINHLKVRP